LGYYDALTANEAFRSSVIEKYKGAEHKNTVCSKLVGYFPYRPKDADQEAKKIYLPPLSETLSNKSFANHVGITTLVISKEGYPILFQQGRYMDQSAGKFVVSGSGSADYADIKNADTDNFLDLVKYAMAREFSEEGSQFHKDRNTQQTINDIAKRTMIIGYFRWIDKCGNPEFIGVTRSDKTVEEIEADTVEVYKLPEEYGEKLDFKIKKMSDFSVLATKIKALPKPMALSCAMVIWRLEQISNKEEKSKEKRKVADCLGLKNS
jgi:hypothetical protein